MDIILKHIIPIACLLAAIAAAIVAEYLLGRRLLKDRPALSGKLRAVSVAVSLLAGAGLFVYLIGIGAGIEYTLPVILLVLLGTMI